MGRQRPLLIDRREILEMAERVSLIPHTVEKDYALGWLLAGIYAHEELKDKWLFKGGTCLKKCFFETYRFSEDLDFTLLDAGHIDEAFLKRVFAEVGAWVYDRSGIEMPADRQDFEFFRNPRDNIACQGKVSYRGPISSRDLPRIKLDLTADERVVLPPKRVKIFHPYTDAPPDGIEVLAYDYVEAFAEKFRALGERTRPRDLYDVVQLYRNAEARPGQVEFLAVLRQKCEFKGIEIPQIAVLEPHRSDLEAGWQHMLAASTPCASASAIVLGRTANHLRLASRCAVAGNASVSNRGRRHGHSRACGVVAIWRDGAVTHRDYPICCSQSAHR
jgi:predicted nucleotidyltransferase component of viral defense system